MRTIIVDDEPKGRNILQQLLTNQCDGVEVIATAANVDEALRAIDQYKPAVVFLDVEMPGKSGFDLLRELGDIDFKIVFVTAHNHYSLKAIKFHAFDYLLKPVDLDELRLTVERLKNEIIPKQKMLEPLLHATSNNAYAFGKIAIASVHEIELVNTQDILYCEACSVNTFVFLNNGKKIVATRHLKEYEELLDQHFFFRIHHSFLVNMKHVAKYIKGEGGSVMLSNGKELEVSRRRKPAFLEMLSIYMNNK